MKSRLDASHSIGWNRRGLTTVRAGEDEPSLLVSKGQLDQALLAVDMLAHIVMRYQRIKKLLKPTYMPPSLDFRRHWRSGRLS